MPELLRRPKDRLHWGAANSLSSFGGRRGRGERRATLLTIRLPISDFFQHRLMEYAPHSPRRCSNTDPSPPRKELSKDERFGNRQSSLDPNTTHFLAKSCPYSTRA